MAAVDLALLPKRPEPGPSRDFNPTVYWYLSFRCNLACKHCWVNSSPAVDTSEDLQGDELLRAVDNIATLNPSQVILTGGEPLMHPDILPLLDRLSSVPIRTSIETNAMFVTPQLLEHVHAGIAAGNSFHFAVSLDGGTRETHDWLRGRGSFVGTVAGLHRLRANGLPADIQCVVHHKNWRSMPDLVELARDLDVAFLKFVLATPVGRATRHADELAWTYEEIPEALDTVLSAIEGYPGTVVLKVPPAWIPPNRQHAVRRLRQQGCQIANITSCSFPLLGVLNDGSVTICAQTRESGEAYFGNIRDLTLEQIWEQQRLTDMREDYLAAKLTGICAECVFNQECRGACRAHAFTEYGSFDSPYPTCRKMDEDGHFPDYYQRSYVAALQDRLTS